MSDMTSGFFVGPLDEPDKYRLRRQIGGGGEAELWQADLALGDDREQVAVKVLRATHEDRETWRDRWTEQADLLRLIRHPGVVGVHCAFEGPRMHPAGQADPDESALYLVMNWVDGQDLRDWAPQHASPEHRAAVFTVLTQIADVLDWLHSGRATPSGRPVVHGDISPANVIVNNDGQAVLVDFGLFRMTRHVTSLPAGTQGYLAPELLRDGAYSPASDRYAFGGVAYYLLTGTHPPAAGDALAAGLRAVFPQPAELAQAMRMFAADPAARPTAGEWVRALRLRTSTTNASFSGGFAPMRPGSPVFVPPGSKPVPPHPPAVGAGSHKPWWMVAAGVAFALVLTAGGVAAATLLKDEQKDPSRTSAGGPTSTTSPTLANPTPVDGPTSSPASPPSLNSVGPASRPAGKVVALSSVEPLTEVELGAVVIDGKRYSSSLINSCGGIYEEYNLLRAYKWFSGSVGVGDDAPTGTTVTFSIYVDDTQKASVTVGLFETKVIEADLTGGRRMRLVADVQDDFNGYCESPAFVDSTLVMAG
ncbi:MAG TPA: protein kinase [Micromonospora sp.]